MVEILIFHHLVIQSFKIVDVPEYVAINFFLAIIDVDSFPSFFWNDFLWRSWSESEELVLGTQFEQGW